MARDRMATPWGDLPYYAGVPVRLGARGWTLALAGVAAGFACLLLPFAGQWPAAVLFVALPLIGLRLAAGSAWTAIFRRLTWRDALIGLAFGLLNLVVTLLVGLLVMEAGTPSTSNPANALIAAMGPAELVNFFVHTALQLFGEELISVIPFLALLTLAFGPLRLPRPAALLVALIGVSLLFAALHLPTYGWNLVQTFATIGVARLVLILPYLLTRNIWSSTIAHVVNDWLLFGAALVLGANTAP